MHILGHLMNSAFVDILEYDLDSLRHMNDVIPVLNRRARRQIGYAVHEVEQLEISPSRELNQLAQEHYAELPKALSSYIKPVGAGTLLSLVLFEQAPCSVWCCLSRDSVLLCISSAIMTRWQRPTTSAGFSTLASCLDLGH